MESIKPAIAGGTFLIYDWIPVELESPAHGFNLLLTGTRKMGAQLRRCEEWELRPKNLRRVLP